MSRYSHPTISRTAKSLSQPANPDNRLIVDSRSSHDRGAVMPTRWDSTALDLLRGREPEGVLLAPPLGESRQVGLDCAAPATPPVYAGSPLTLSSSHSTSPGGESRRVGLDEAVLMMTVPTSRSPFTLSSSLPASGVDESRVRGFPDRETARAGSPLALSSSLPASGADESHVRGFRDRATAYAGSPLTLSSSHSTSPGGGSRRVGFDEAVLMMTVPTSRSPFFLSPGLWRRRKSRKRLSRPPGRTCGQANADSRSVAPPLPTSPFGESRRVGFRGAFGRGPPSPAL